jgi:malate dehydrogenase (oxaloacetate-decarboxylating)
VIVCDTKGIISRNREDLNIEKQALLGYTNQENRQGDLRAALTGADVFIGVSKGNLLTAEDIKLMAPNALVFAMANPTPEIMPDVALQAGAFVVGTGRSDFPNQVNNVLAFPGIFRGALDAGAPQITNAMKIAAAYALAEYVKEPTPSHILPDVFDKGVAAAVATAVAKAAQEDHWG